MNTDKALEVVAAVYLAIKESGDNGLPSGHLYANVMGVMSLHCYQQIIEILKKTGKITETGYLLKAT